MDSILEAKKGLEKHKIGRDTFISVLSALRGDEETSVVYRGKTLNFKKEGWMNNVKNIRKFYESVASNRLKDMADEMDVEINSSDIKLMKTAQNLRDKNIELRKYYRESFRKINKSEEILNEIKECVKSIDLGGCYTVVDNKVLSSDKIGIMHLSDLHLNEIINEPNNKFDFKVASSRLKDFASQAIKYFKDNNVSTIYLINTGDNINSNRRPSEKINSGTGRVRASMVAVKLLVGVLMDLSKHFEVNVSFCSSNESRIEEVNELDELSASENFDIIIYNMLKMILSDKTNDRINFVDCDVVEGVINIKEFDKNILITHGAQIPATGIQKKIQEIKGKYASRGILLTYIFFGDKHASYIGCNFSRCAALCGGNGYSDNMLGFDSRASQNLYLMDKNGAVNGLRVDLQNSNCEGYDISNEIEKYNIKGLN